MKSMFTAALLAAAFGLAIGAEAQNTAGSAEKAATGKEQTMTITGCLSEATGGQGEFLLAKVPAKATTSGTESTATTYRLIGGGKVNLKEHVGHKVQVTGKMAGEAGRGSGDQPAASGQGSPTEPKLNVTALKHIATTCEASTPK
jgi:hypothetical protein